MPTFYNTYCDECIAVHWVEVGPPPANRVTCHGKNFYPRETPTHYTRKAPAFNGRIGIELCPKASTPAPLTDWILADLPAAAQLDPDF